ncbi:thiol oxidoreductase, partial [Vibrio parahaemolyticus]|nr:thiol oxidoreductase [Vibrio parahaemolyticus]
MKPYLLSAFAAILSTSAMAYDVKSGGNTSVKKDGANAYSLPATNLPMSKRLDFSVG